MSSGSSPHPVQPAPHSVAQSVTAPLADSCLAGAGVLSWTRGLWWLMGESGGVDEGCTAPRPWKQDSRPCPDLIYLKGTEAQETETQ